MNEKLNTLAIVQARMGSTRLSGKVMMMIEDKPMLWHIVNRLNHSSLLRGTVVATSELAADDVIEGFCKKYKFDYFRGSETDVLSRYYEAAKFYKGDFVVRVTGDCPLIDPKVLGRTVLTLLDDQKGYDGSSNVIRRTYPRGLDTEVVSFEALERCHRQAREGRHREHVTAYMYENPLEFKFHSVEQDIDLSSLRWTVDEYPDFKFVSEIYKRLYPAKNIFFMEDVLEILKREPSISDINRDIEQKNTR